VVEAADGVQESFQYATFRCAADNGHAMPWADADMTSGPFVPA
jgi:predicted secreted hydrolase